MHLYKDIYDGNITEIIREELISAITNNYETTNWEIKHNYSEGDVYEHGCDTFKVQILDFEKKPGSDSLKESIKTFSSAKGHMLEVEISNEIFVYNKILRQVSGQNARTKCQSKCQGKCLLGTS